MALLTLRVRDLATIADATLELGNGLNVLTGETGAGKSMLVDALALLLGDRADRAVVRPAAARAVIEGVFGPVPPSVRTLLQDTGLDLDESLIVRREVTAEGRSRAWINSSQVTIGMLAQLGELLVDLHGQHQNIQLFDRVTQLSLLDQYADAAPALEAVKQAHAMWQGFSAQHGELTARRDAIRMRADWLRHLVEEINSLALKSGELEALKQESLRLSQTATRAELSERIAAAVGAERDGALKALVRLEKALNALERLDPEVAQWKELQDSAYAQLDELGRLAADYLTGLSEDPGRLAEIENRRDAITRLTHKHGVDPAGLLALRDSSQAELDLLDTVEIDLHGLAAQADAARATLISLSADLTALRTAAAGRLSREVSRLLPSLGLKEGELKLIFESTDGPSAAGAESVVFLARLNRGMEPRPLSRVASGGELSRLMLALKVVLAKHDAVPTLVFDEIDQGIGGEVGSRTGEALARVAQRHQVLVITHLPQIAAHADHHLRVSKSQKGALATSDLTVLHGEDRVDELARMLGDATGKAARDLALTLLRVR